MLKEDCCFLSTNRARSRPIFEPLLKELMDSTGKESQGNSTGGTSRLITGPGSLG